MPSCSIKPYFRCFTRVKIAGQWVVSKENVASIDVHPDIRFSPICHKCKKKAVTTYQKAYRAVRDLNIGSTVIFLNILYRKVVCAECRCVRTEYFDFVLPYLRVTKRLAQCIHELCKVTTVKEVAEHFGLDWKTIKEIDKRFLEVEFGKTDYTGLRIIAVDEISRHRHHDYLTVVIDYETGRIVWIGEARKESTLDSFFSEMPLSVRERIEAIAMDMWDPYIASIRKWCPNARIVFDLFHVVKEFNKVIDKVRNQEYRKASESDKRVLKGTKYLLLKNSKNLKSEERPHLKQILNLNENLSTVYILKDALKKIWSYKYRKSAEKALDNWCWLAYESNIKPVIKFAERLQRHKDGILNHCYYPIHTGKIEGVNNTLKVIKRKAYGFRDTRYFTLKAKQAFAGNSTH
jgi:transposase